MWRRLVSFFRIPRAGKIVGLAALSLLAGCESDSSGAVSCDAHMATFVSIPAGEFTKSLNPIYPEEGTPEKVSVAGFKIASHEVTNAEFARFADATGYQTDAERSRANPAEQGSAVFPLNTSDSLNDPTAPDGANARRSEERWRLVNDASWRHPDGAGSNIDARTHHPVVHVSLRDARAYAEWAGGRLATELEWEYAANLGLSDPQNSTSGAYSEDGSPVANTWQGVFPIADSGADGFHGTAPVGCYPASKVGLYDMIGNVWEWTDTPVTKSSHLIKGGSFLCANNFCKRYRPAARQQQDIDFSTNHIGFRIVKD